MATLHTDLEALMPEPVGFRTRYRGEPEMIGHYPWTYADAARRRRKYDRPACEYEDLYTAEQMREAIRAATERAAKQKWQPIKTAPKDQIILLGYEPHWRLDGSRRVYEGRWHDEQQTWTSANGFLLHTGVTRWMPLPDPPDAAAIRASGGKGASDGKA